jgi:hypothetical protein
MQRRIVYPLLIQAAVLSLALLPAQQNQTAAAPRFEPVQPELFALPQVSDIPLILSEPTAGRRLDFIPVTQRWDQGA